MSKTTDYFKDTNNIDTYFHRNDATISKVPWIKLTIDEKLEKISDYFLRLCNISNIYNVAEQQTNEQISEQITNIQLNIQPNDSINIPNQTDTQLQTQTTPIVPTTLSQGRQYFQNIKQTQQNYTISQDDLNSIINLIKSNKLRLKKEIIYDEVNNRIISIPGLIKKQHSNQYIYSPPKISQQDLSRKSAVSKLFRKK